MKILHKNGRVIATATDEYTGPELWLTAPADFDISKLDRYTVENGVIVLVVDPSEWFIDIGPFYDRFGAAKMAVLTSADPGVKAIMADVQIRKWIDLQRADVISALAYIGSKVPLVDAALQTHILTTPVSPEENLALRRLYFS